MSVCKGSPMLHTNLGSVPESQPAGDTSHLHVRMTMVMGPKPQPLLSWYMCVYIKWTTITTTSALNGRFPGEPGLTGSLWFSLFTCSRKEPVWVSNTSCCLWTQTTVSKALKKMAIWFSLSLSSLLLLPAGLWHFNMSRLGVILQWGAVMACLHHRMVRMHTHSLTYHVFARVVSRCFPCSFRLSKCPSPTVSPP